MVTASVIVIGAVRELLNLGLQSSAPRQEIGRLTAEDAYDLVLGRHQFSLTAGCDATLGHLTAKRDVGTGLPTGGAE